MKYSIAVNVGRDRDEEKDMMVKARRKNMLVRSGDKEN